jgi:predicted nuclease with TOPRIM domain
MKLSERIAVKHHLQERVQGLKAELATGQKVLADLQARESNLKATLLRISGAIQVLEELLMQEQSGDVESGASPPGDDQRLAVG